MAVEVITDYPMFIDGVATPSSNGRWLHVRSPATPAELFDGVRVRDRLWKC